VSKNIVEEDRNGAIRRDTCSGFVTWEYWSKEGKKRSIKGRI
jgi:hypothetical protein